MILPDEEWTVSSSAGDDGGQPLTVRRPREMVPTNLVMEMGQTMAQGDCGKGEVDG